MCGMRISARIEFQKSANRLPEASAFGFSLEPPLRPSKQEGRIPEEPAPYLIRGRRARCATFPDGTRMYLPEMPLLLANRPRVAWTAGRQGGLLCLLSWPHKKVRRAKRGTLLILESLPTPNSAYPSKKPTSYRQQASDLENFSDHIGVSVNLPKATPRSQPSPLPARANDTLPLVITWALAEAPAPACASPVA